MYILYIFVYLLQLSNILECTLINSVYQKIHMIVSSTNLVHILNINIRYIYIYCIFCKKPIDIKL